MNDLQNIIISKEAMRLATVLSWLTNFTIMVCPMMALCLMEEQSYVIVLILMFPALIRLLCGISMQRVLRRNLDNKHAI